MNLDPKYMPPTKRIAILGTGPVAYLLPKSFTEYGVAHHVKDVIFVSRNYNKAAEEQNPAKQPIKYSTLSYGDDLGELDIIVVACSVKLNIDTEDNIDLRPQLLKDNTRLVLEPNVIPLLKKYSETHPQKLPHIIVATNPVYQVTSYLYHRCQQLGLPFESRHFSGIGSRIDANRLNYITADIMGVDRDNVSNAMVFGEHGESMVPIISQLTVNNKKLWDFFKKPVHIQTWRERSIDESVRAETGIFLTGCGRAKGERFENWERLARVVARHTRRELGTAVMGPSNDICETLSDLFTQTSYQKIYDGSSSLPIEVVGAWSPNDQVYAGLPSVIDNEGVRFVGDKFINDLGNYERGRVIDSIQRIRTQVVEMFEVAGIAPPEKLIKVLNQYDPSKGVAPTMAI